MTQHELRETWAEIARTNEKGEPWAVGYHYGFSHLPYEYWMVRHAGLPALRQWREGWRAGRDAWMAYRFGAHQPSAKS